MKGGRDRATEKKKRHEKGHRRRREHRLLTHTGSTDRSANKKTMDCELANPNTSYCCS